MQNNIELKRGMVVQLNIPAARPIKLLSGVLHEAGHNYKVLGTHGSLVRLSRISDHEKIMVLPQDIWVRPAMPAKSGTAPAIS